MKKNINMTSAILALVMIDGKRRTQFLFER